MSEETTIDVDTPTDSGVVTGPLAALADPSAALAAAKRLHAATAKGARRGGFHSRVEVDDESDPGPAAKRPGAR